MCPLNSGNRGQVASLPYPPRDLDQGWGGSLDREACRVEWIPWNLWLQEYCILWLWKCCDCAIGGGINKIIGYVWVFWQLPSPISEVQNSQCWEWTRKMAQHSHYRMHRLCSSCALVTGVQAQRGSPWHRERWGSDHTSQGDDRFDLTGYRELSLTIWSLLWNSAPPTNVGQSSRST